MPNTKRTDFAVLLELYYVFIVQSRFSVYNQSWALNFNCQIFGDLNFTTPLDSFFNGSIGFSLKFEPRPSFLSLLKQRFIQRFFT